MGCDIHVYPEYVIEDDDREKPYVCSLGEYWLGRNYILFGCMAGVRSCNPGIVSPRGVPDNMGWDAATNFFLTAIPDEDFGERQQYEYNTISHSKAKELSAKYGAACHDTNTKYWKVKNPDWHNASWLTLDELYTVRRYYIEELLCELPKKKQQKYRKIIKSCKTNKELLNHRFEELECSHLNGLIGMLMMIEHTDPRAKTRIVFWFDN